MLSLSLLCPPAQPGCIDNLLRHLNQSVSFLPLPHLCITAIVELRQEIALSRLSQMLDLPVLEGLVCHAATTNNDPGYDNAVFFNFDSQASQK